MANRLTIIDWVKLLGLAQRKPFAIKWHFHPSRERLSKSTGNLMIPSALIEVTPSQKTDALRIRFSLCPFSFLLANQAKLMWNS